MTAVLVISASFHSLPVSTTHVKVGSLLGIGANSKKAKWRKIVEILFAWISTVPCAAIISAICMIVLSRVNA